MNSHTVCVCGRNSCLASSPSVLFHNKAWKLNYSDSPFQKQCINSVINHTVIHEHVTLDVCVWQHYML